MKKYLFPIILILGFVLSACNLTSRVPKPETPVSVRWDKNHNGVVMSMTLENLAYDCRLDQEMLDLMESSKITLTSPLKGPLTVPATLSLPFTLPDDRTGTVEYFLTYDDQTDQFEMTLLNCNINK